MTFINPTGLYGLLLVPVILILHLLRERRRRQIVSNIRLWSFLEEEVRGPRARRIPITWILILDMLIGILLALAWSQPQIKLPLPVKDARHFIILIDVSASMQTRDWTPSRFDQAVLEATTMINGLSSKDIATIITFGENPKLVADTRQMGIQEALTSLIDLQANEVGHTIDAALVLGLSTIDGNIPVDFQVFTDAAFPLDRLEIEAAWHEFPYPISWHFFPGETNNQAVMDVEVQEIDERNIDVLTRVANYGYTASDRLLVLLADGEPVDSVQITIPRESTITHLWNVDKQAKAFTVALSGGDEYKADDTFTVGVTPKRQVNVVYVTENPAPVDSAIRALRRTDISIYTPEDYSPLTTADLTIFRNTLPSSWPEGTILVIEPPEDPGTGNMVFQPRLKQPLDITADDTLLIPAADPLLNGIDFGSVRWVQLWGLSEVPDGFSMLAQVGDSPLLLHGRVGNSEIIILLANLERGNFTQDPAFIVLLANIIQITQGSYLPENVSLTQPIPLPDAASNQLLRISPPGSDTIEYRQSWPVSFEETFNPGAYIIEQQNVSGGLITYTVGVNAADPLESDVRPKKWMSNFSQNLSMNSGLQSTVNERLINLTPYLLVAALIFLVLEALRAWR